MASRLYVSEAKIRGHDDGRRPAYFRICPPTGLLFHEPAEKLMPLERRRRAWCRCWSAACSPSGGADALAGGAPAAAGLVLPGADRARLDMLVFWIIFFEIAVLYFCASTLLRCRLAAPRWAWLGFALMVIGAVTNNVRGVPGRFERDVHVATCRWARTRRSTSG